ncbi:FHA domain-containing protein [Allocoleopsis franciscana]|uniref:FHA domain-containing protein n=1 Tax=Allocoleopsis franciscana PCC 7113 TaxID=1173027 RepID=K9WAD7_9CYAN|nr:FHA domain-containing protein [Allocoleopsis franciscana]AFZ16729.1 FHA domain-containing protein [Allocoleopsis franciscana PCC 7113]
MDRDLEIQEQYESLLKKRSLLREAVILETNPAIKLQREQQLKEVEKEIFEFEDKVELLRENRIILNLKGTNNEVHCVFDNNAVIGRSATYGFWIDDDSKEISKLHAVIYYKSKNNAYWIDDLKSVNGTYVNGIKIEEPMQIFVGTQIQLGSSPSFLFEHNKDDLLSQGVLIQHNFDGEEVARYIIAPKGKVLLGTNSNEVVRFPNFREGKSLGSLIRETDGFHFIGTDNEEQLLEHGGELSFDFLRVGVTIPSIVLKETLGETKLTENDLEPSQGGMEPEPKPPGEGDVPPYMRKVNIFCSLFIVGIGIILNFTCFRPNINQIDRKLIDECIAELKNPDSHSWFSAKAASNFPTNKSVKILFTRSLQKDKITEYFLNKSSLFNKKNVEISDYINPDISVESIIRNKINQQNSKDFWLGIEKSNFLGILLWKVTYWHPAPSSAGIPIYSTPIFKWNKTSFLYLPSVFILSVVVLSSRLTRYWIIERYRNRLQQDYDDFQKKRTEKIFEAKSYLDEARKLAQSGKLAQALAKTNELLKSTSMSFPVYKEIIELKKVVLAQIESGGGAITVESLNGINRTLNHSTDASKLLYLRILGTPYAYQAPYGLETISIGRQRRKQNVSDNVGNDVIIRVPGSDKKSLCISRRHLEIQRINTEYFVIDKSGGKTSLNGKILTKNEPSRLQSGDRLLIAGVITLEVLIRVKLSGAKTSNVIRINPPTEVQDNFLIEASIGDMVTEVFDD